MQMATKSPQSLNSISSLTSTPTFYVILTPGFTQAIYLGQIEFSFPSKFWMWSFSFTLLFCSVQFSCSVVSSSLQPHGLQHARLPRVHHQLPESTQTNVHCITNVIQPSIRYLDSNVSKGVGKGQLWKCLLSYPFHWNSCHFVTSYKIKKVFVCFPPSNLAATNKLSSSPVHLDCSK